MLADALRGAAPALSRAVEAALLPEAGELSPTRLRERALELLAELDSTAVDQRRAEAQRAADVRTYPTADGMAVLTAEMSAEEAAACHFVIDQLAAMAKADGDERPIGQIRSAIHSMLVLRAADHGLGGVSVQLTVTAALDGLEGASNRGGDVAGFAITAAHLRELLRRVEAIGLTTPVGGSLTFALTDERGRLLATVTAAELARLARGGCPQHPGRGVRLRRAGHARPRRRVLAAGRAAAVRHHPRPAVPDAELRSAGRLGRPRSRGGARGRRGTSCTNLCCALPLPPPVEDLRPRLELPMDADGTLHVTSPSGITRTTRPPGLRPPEPAPSPPDPADDPPPF